MKRLSNAWTAAIAGLFSLALTGAAGAAPMMGASLSPAGMTGAFYMGGKATETYTKNFYCDKTVPSMAKSGCEQGAGAEVPPPGHYDPEYAIVPIGFTPSDAMMMNCKPNVKCVAHPATIDMTRVVNTLALVKKTTHAMLLPMLGNAAVPPHNHYLTTTYGGKPQWWNVVIIGCTSAKTYNAILAHKSFAYIQKLQAAGDPTLLKPTKTNLFLYFAAHPASAKMTM